MEKFFNLPVEKQKKIIDAALNSFGTNGYKKASVNDIAEAAGISKSMVFHYFGTKKELYFYLIEYCGGILMNEIREKFDSTVTDFFDRIKLATNIKVAVMKKHPAILSFLNSSYFETAEEVRGEIASLLAKGEVFRGSIVLDGMDVKKFKDGIDPKLVMKMLTWLAEGYVNAPSNKAEYDIDVLCEEFDQCISMLKKNFYKEEYL